MKYLLLSVLTICSFINLNAQEKDKVFEKLQGNQIGLIYSGSAYSLAYRIKKEDKKDLLIRSTFATINTSQFENLNVNTGFTINKMKDHDLSDKFFISHGLGLGLRIQTNLSSPNTFIGITPSINYRLEFNYKIKDNFHFGVALNPNLGLITSYNVGSTNFNYNVGLNASNGAQLHLFYTI